MNWVEENRLIPVNPAGGPSRIDVLACTANLYGRLISGIVLGFVMR